MAAETCTHLDTIDQEAQQSGTGCDDCLRIGGRWVHLRMCRSCGHVGCCDSSPGRHATAHNASSGHPIMSSFEPGEDWSWCFDDELMMRLDGVPQFSHP